MTGMHPASRHGRVVGLTTGAADMVAEVPAWREAV